jgi:hypothetical protein
LIFIFIGTLTFSQTFHLSGKVTDEENAPVDFAEVILSVKDSVLKSELTGEDGSFTFSGLWQENYTLAIKQAGEILHTQDLLLTDNLDLGNIRIQKAKELQNVVVTGQKKLFERKVDRLVFNVENSIAATGGDALDALKVTPGVRVQDNQISLIGKSGISVMVDDRLVQLSGEDLANYLKSIPSDNIKSIEVITTPPAKYDAEGNSGIINIQLKKAKANSWSLDLTGSFTQFKFARFNEGANFKYNKDKLSLYVNAFHNDGAFLYRTEGQKIYYTDKFYNSFGKRKLNYGDNISTNAGLDYDLSKKISVGFQYIYNYSTIPSAESNDTKVYSSTDKLIQTFANSEAIDNGNSVNFHTTYKIDTLGRKIDVNVDYFDYNTKGNETFKTKEYDNFTDYIAGSYASANNGSKQGITNYSAKVDVEHPLKWLRLSYGGKLAFTKNNSFVYYYDLTSGVPVFQTNKSDEFDYDESLQSLYISGNKKMGKWETQLGFRMENTQIKGVSQTLSKTHKNDYLKIFPTFYIQYVPNDNNNFSFNYSKRISRPPFYSLNPFVRYTNPYSTSEGNPFLSPSYTHNLELSYTRKNNWNSSVYMSFSDDMRTQVSYISNDNINTAAKYENAYNQSIIGLSESYTFKKWKWWESSNRLSIQYNKITSLFPAYISDHDGFAKYFETSNNFILNKNRTLSLSLNYGIIFSGYVEYYKIKNLSNLGFGAKALLLKKQLSLSLYASDIFKTHKIKVVSYFSGIKTEFLNYEFRQSIRFSVRYSFGNNAIRTKNVKGGNEEEKGRAQ